MSEITAEDSEVMKSGYVLTAHTVSSVKGCQVK